MSDDKTKTARARWTFEPLTVDKLQKASNSKRVWPHESVASFNEQLHKFSLEPLDKLCAPKADANSKARANKLSKEIAAIDAAIANLETAGVLPPVGIPNSLRFWRGENRRASLLSDRQAKERELRTLRTPRGPRPNWALGYFIKIVADACDGVGIVVSAERIKSKGTLDGPLEGRLDGPFLRVLRLAYARLPEERRKLSESALCYFARNSGIPWWKSDRSQTALQARNNNHSLKLPPQ